MPKKNQKKAIAPRERIERFVMRARRVRAHSLVRDGSIDTYAECTVTVKVSEETGVMKSEFNVVPNEETLESLATRLRPMLLPTESIYLPEVIKAIRELVDFEILEGNDALECGISSAENWFEHRYRNKDCKKFDVQLLDGDGIPKTDFMSDPLLGDTWLYADTVHSDPHGKKAKGLEVGYGARYKAASTLFCECARVVVDLLGSVEGLAERGALELSERVWTEPVVYAEAERETVATKMFYLPRGTEIPSGTKPEELPGATEITPMLSLILVDPDGRAYVNVLDEEGKTLDSQLAHRATEEGAVRFLIADVLKLEVLQSAISDKVVEGVGFLPVPGKEGEAAALLRHMEAPHCIEVHYLLDGQEESFRLSFNLDTGAESEGRGDAETNA